METPSSDSSPAKLRGIRWWPAWLILLLAAGAILVVQLREDFPFQRRNLTSFSIGLGAAALLLLWWIILSRSRWRLRLGVTLGVLAGLGLGASLFKIRGVSGDLVPILGWRWVKSGRAAPASVAAPAVQAAAPVVAVPSGEFPQFLGPTRDGILSGLRLDPDWSAHSPQLLWRQPVGAGWSGFVVAAGRAITQEQDGPDELVTAYDLLTGRRLWAHADAAHYGNPIGGEGPRATPTIVGERVYTLGSTGRLNVLDLATGRVLWTRDLIADSGATMPEWGYAGSPLMLGDKVIVSAGGHSDKSLLAYRADTGELLWGAGTDGAGYGSPFLTTLAGRSQILAFNGHRITAHDPINGTVLWEHPWGIGYPHVAVPVLAGSDRVMFTSGYGVGAELLQVATKSGGELGVSRVWQSKKLKAKFANPVARDGFVYGLDDGILACVDLADGSQRWKEGRYGHGQGLLVADLFLLMAENGELILLRPTPTAPNELARHRVFSSKTWNPIALAGEFLLVRNDQEAACLKVTLAK